MNQILGEQNMREIDPGLGQPWLNYLLCICGRTLRSLRDRAWVSATNTNIIKVDFQGRFCNKYKANRSQAR